MICRRAIVLGCLAIALLLPCLPLGPVVVQAQTVAPLPLSAYPRPTHDNGWGIHWVPTTFTQPDDVVDQLVDELVRLNIRWVKLLVPPDETGVAHKYLLERLRAHGIMPIVRIYVRYNDPVPGLERIVRLYVPLGVRYFEVYTDVNLEGTAGGWRAGEEVSVVRVVDLWADAARAIRRGGGYPALPVLAAGGHHDDLEFLRGMLRLIKSRGYESLLHGAWLPVNNAFFNHPVDYPYDTVNMTGAPVSAHEVARWQLDADEVNDLNEARRQGRERQMARGYFDGDPLDVDSNAFRKYEAYRRTLVDTFGYEIPIISTAGGAVYGSQEDPRYPAVTHRDVAESTIYAYHYMLDEAPACYFAFTAWVMANQAGGGFWNPSFDRAAWYTDLGGGKRPVVDAVASSSRRGELRPASGGAAQNVVTPAASPTPTATPANVPATGASAATAPHAGMALPGASTASVTAPMPTATATASSATASPSRSGYALFADGRMTVSWQRETGNVHLRLAVVQPLSGELQLWHRGQVLARWALYVLPGDPLGIIVEGQDLGEGSLGVRVIGDGGAMVAEYGCAKETCP